MGNLVDARLPLLLGVTNANRDQNETGRPSAASAIDGDERASSRAKLQRLGCCPPSVRPVANDMVLAQCLVSTTSLGPGTENFVFQEGLLDEMTFEQRGWLSLVLMTTLVAAVVVAPGAAKAGAHLDRQFGSNGLGRLPKTFDDSAGLALDGDGRVLVAGEGGISALLPSGLINSSFGTAGVAKPTVPPQVAVGRGGLELSSIAIDNQGRAVVVGDSYSEESPGVVHPLVERFSPTGQVEGDFSSQLPAGADLQQVAIDSAGRIVIKGKATDRSGERDFLARLEESGRTDPSFGNTGLRTLPEVAHWYTETRLQRSWAIGPDDAISVAIKRGRGQSLLQLNSGGARVGTFGEAGVRPFPSRTVLGPLVDPLGRLITWSKIEGVEHRLPNGILIHRLNRDGSADRGFGRHGLIELRIPRLYSAELALDESGHILVAALLKSQIPGSEGRELALYRLREDGRIERSFGRDGMVHFPYVEPPFLDLEEIDVRGEEVAILVKHCGGGCEPIVARVDLGL